MLVQQAEVKCQPVISVLLLTFIKQGENLNCANWYIEVICFLSPDHILIDTVLVKIV